MVPLNAAETAIRKLTGSCTATSRSVAWGGITVGRAARRVAAAEDQAMSSRAAAASQGGGV